MEDTAVSSILKTLKEFQEQPHLTELATNIFDFTQFLLDKDENLTKTGNLNSKAVSLLEARIVELLSIEDTEVEELDA